MPKPGTAKTAWGPNIDKIKHALLQNLRILIPLLAVTVLLGGILITHVHQDNSKNISACGFRDDKTVTVGSHKITAEVASTAQSQQKGLGGRACIGPNEGMLFVFPRSGSYSFWMKDMKFPIDMIWISPGHNAVVVEEDVLPSTYPDSFVNPSDKPAQYVLELQAHASTRLNINPGTPIDF